MLLTFPLALRAVLFESFRELLFQIRILLLKTCLCLEFYLLLCGKLFSVLLSEFSYFGFEGLDHFFQVRLLFKQVILELLVLGCMLGHLASFLINKSL